MGENSYFSVHWTSRYSHYVRIYLTFLEQKWLKLILNNYYYYLNCNKKLRKILLKSTSLRNNIPFLLTDRNYYFYLLRILLTSLEFFWRCIYTIIDRQWSMVAYYYYYFFFILMFNYFFFFFSLIRILLYEILTWNRFLFWIVTKMNKEIVSKAFIGKLQSSFYYFYLLLLLLLFSLS